MEYLFSSPNMVLWHDSVGCRKEPDLFSKHCAHTLQKKKKNSYGCNICIPDLWFEGKNLQCFFPCFLIGGMTKQDWNPNYASPAWQRVSPSGPSRAQGGGFTPVVSLLHDEHTSLSSCILPPASSSKFGKLKQNHHIPYPVRRNPMSWQLWPHGVLLDY